jgi:hypothetical protein
MHDEKRVEVSDEVIGVGKGPRRGLLWVVGGGSVRGGRKLSPYQPLPLPLTSPPSPDGKNFQAELVGEWKNPASPQEERFSTAGRDFPPLGVCVGAGALLSPSDSVKSLRVAAEPSRLGPGRAACGVWLGAYEASPLNTMGRPHSDCFLHGVSPFLTPNVIPLFLSPQAPSLGRQTLHASPHPRAARVSLLGAKTLLIQARIAECGRGEGGAHSEDGFRLDSCR